MSVIAITVSAKVNKVHNMLEGEIGNKGSAYDKFFKKGVTSKFKCDVFANVIRIENTLNSGNGLEMFDFDNEVHNLASVISMDRMLVSVGEAPLTEEEIVYMRDSHRDHIKSAGLVTDA